MDAIAILLAFAVFVIVVLFVGSLSMYLHEEYLKKQRIKAEEKAKQNESPVGKIMQMFVGSWPSYWKVIEVSEETGDLLLRCISSPYYFKKGNWKVGHEVAILPSGFRAYEGSVTGYS